MTWDSRRRQPAAGMAGLQEGQPAAGLAGTAGDTAGVGCGRPEQWKGAAGSEAGCWWSGGQGNTGHQGRAGRQIWQRSRGWVRRLGGLQEGLAHVGAGAGDEGRQEAAAVWGGVTCRGTLGKRQEVEEAVEANCPWEPAPEVAGDGDGRRIGRRRDEWAPEAGVAGGCGWRRRVAGKAGRRSSCGRPPEKKAALAREGGRVTHGIAMACEGVG